MARSSWRKWSERYCILPVIVACVLELYLQYHFVWVDITVSVILTNVIVLTSLLSLIMAIVSLPRLMSWIALLIVVIVWYYLGFKAIWAIT